MTALTITAADVHVVETREQETLPANVDITAGQYIFPNSSGYWALGDSTTGGNNIGKRPAIATRSVKAGQALTGLRKGKISLGNALGGLAIEAPVYVNDTGGSLGDAAGTVSKIVGYVSPAWGATSVDKLLAIDL